VFILYAILYSIARFFLEFLRGDYGTLLLGLKSAQLTSLAIIIIGSIFFVWCGLKQKSQPPEPKKQKGKK
jgi:phosphatidylglycerol:prolipoprotein diacylglycerol transferase